MALRIGKKKAAATTEAGDFSPESLQQAADTASAPADHLEVGETRVYSTAPATTEPDFDLGTSTTGGTDAMPDTTVAATHVQYTEPVMPTETVHAQAVHTQAVHAEALPDIEQVPVVATKKRSPLPALLGLGALGLLGLGALAWSRLTPAEETEDAPIARRPPVARPTPAKVATKTAPAKVIVVKAPTKPSVKTATRPVVVRPAVTKTATTKTVSKQTTVQSATPGTPLAATTTTTQTTVATAFVPDPQAAAAAIANGPRTMAPADQPTPTIFPPPAARPGKWADPNEVTVVQAARVAPPVAPAVKARLKALWKQGADAKHRNDFAGARRAWSQALKLAPNYPGFAESIAKLPSAR